jgi:hypothetical protein
MSDMAATWHVCAKHRLTVVFLPRLLSVPLLQAASSSGRLRIGPPSRDHQCRTRSFRFNQPQQSRRCHLLASLAGRQQAWLFLDWMEKQALTKTKVRCPHVCSRSRTAAKRVANRTSVGRTRLTKWSERTGGCRGGEYQLVAVHLPPIRKSHPHFPLPTKCSLASPPPSAWRVPDQPYNLRHCVVVAAMPPKPQKQFTKPSQQQCMRKSVLSVAALVEVR